MLLFFQLEKLFRVVSRALLRRPPRACRGMPSRSPTRKRNENTARRELKTKIFSYRRMRLFQYRSNCRPVPLRASLIFGKKIETGGRTGFCGYFNPRRQMRARECPPRHCCRLFGAVLELFWPGDFRRTPTVQTELDGEI